MSAPSPVHVSAADLPAWTKALRSSPNRPVAVHLNADTSWVIQIPRPASSSSSSSSSSISLKSNRTHFNIVLDPWLRGPQSDVASWFSTQLHVVAPAVDTLAGLSRVLCAVETGSLDIPSPPDDAAWYIDAVAISHEFTDHCHQATLLQLPPATPIYAADAAADLIRSWSHFTSVTTAPGFTTNTPWHDIPTNSGLPSWLRIARVITPGNAMYYHSALVLAFDVDAGKGPEAIVYSPHGIHAQDLSFLPAPESGLSTLALLHGMHDVRIWLMKQLNLGGLNGVDAVRATAARYWIATHDEVKDGAGMIAPLLVRTQYTIKQAEEHDKRDVDDYCFLELASGAGVVLI